MTKLHTDEGVDKGVQAAPHEGHALGDVTGVEEPVLVVAVFSSSLCCEYCVPKQDQVIGHLAYQEDSDHSENHLDGFIAFKVTSLAKGLHNAAVTEAHDQEREGKSQNHLARLDGYTEQVTSARESGTCVVNDSGVLNFRYGEDQCQHPDDNRWHLAEKHCSGAMAVSGHGLGDGEVAVNADGAEK